MNSSSGIDQKYLRDEGRKRDEANEKQRESRITLFPVSISDLVLSH